jgi:DNA-binding GntR family transcriptional regulator
MRRSSSPAHFSPHRLADRTDVVSELVCQRGDDGRPAPVLVLVRSAARRVPSPTYQRIADDLRRSIGDDTLPPGAKLPSRHELARQYDVSDRVAVEAVRLLIAEGFSPFRADMTEARMTGTWESSTVYTFMGDGTPVTLSVSWEPAALTTGTAIMLPEEGPHAGQGVVERMFVIGQEIVHAEEMVSARPALASEAERLGIRPGATVLTIARTYHAAERPVETADIVIPVERYALVYEVPVR